MSALVTAQAGVVDLLSAARWDATTPCEGWDVAELARHLVVGERAFTIALGGATYDLAALDADVRRLAETDLAEAYADASAALRAAYEATPADRPVRLPFGPRDREVAAQVRTLEAVVHGWDLGRALGRAPRLGTDADLAALVDVADALRAGLDAARPGHGALGAPVEADADAPALDRVVARFGRDPAWTPSDAGR